MLPRVFSATASSWDFREAMVLTRPSQTLAAAGADSLISVAMHTSTFEVTASASELDAASTSLSASRYATALMALTLGRLFLTPGSMVIWYNMVMRASVVQGTPRTVSRVDSTYRKPVSALVTS